MLQTKSIEYYDNKTLLEGHLAYDATINTKRPVVLVAHDWSGRNTFACEKANALAKLGYVGFALDMYGKGIFGESKEEKSALMHPFIQNRDLLLQRISSAVSIVKTLDQVDATHIAAIGFCFGGLCVLDLARSGINIKGVVSFHGLFNSPANYQPTSIKAKVLALHGHDDPMCLPEQVLSFQHEMTQANADWQTHVYGGTMHAFTNPIANDPGFGTVYNARANHRSWIAMQNFLEEIFPPASNCSAP